MYLRIAAMVVVEAVGRNGTPSMVCWRVELRSVTWRITEPDGNTDVGLPVQAEHGLKASKNILRRVSVTTGLCLDLSAR